MEQNIYGKFDDEVILQGYHPRIANVASADYTAASFKGKDGKTRQYPFIPSHPVSLKMKVTFWDDVTSLWTFEAGKDPILLKKIFKTPAPVVVENGAATETKVTSIQVVY